MRRVFRRTAFATLVVPAMLAVFLIVCGLSWSVTVVLVIVAGAISYLVFERPLDQFGRSRLRRRELRTAG